MSRFVMPGYNPTPIQSPQNALMQGIEMQRAQQGNALQNLQLQAFMQRQQQAQQEQQRAAAMEQERQKYLGSVDPSQGPAMPFNPLSAFRAGFRPEEIKALQPQPQKLMNVGAGGAVFDPATGKPVFTAPFKPEPQKLPQIGELQSFRDSLPQGDPRRREVQAVIDNQTRAPKYAAGPGAGPAADPAMGADPAQTALNKRFGKPPANRRWKQDGSLEIIPGSADDTKAQAGEMGKGSVTDVAASLRDMFNKLDEAGGITNPQNRWGTNLAAGLASSDAGQAAGKLFGTENQSLRNTIAQQRPLLLQAIMKATGMSAKQMDSNAELKLYLATATDPTLDVAANRRALDMIETLYGKGSTGTPTAPTGKTVKRTGTANGRKVVEYTDGSIEYAD